MTTIASHRFQNIRCALLCAGVGIFAFALSGCSGGGGGGTGPGTPRTGSITVTGDDVAMTGYIQSVGKKELLVYDSVVKVLPQTKIEGDGGIPLTFEDLIVGMWTKINGKVDKTNNGNPPPGRGNGHVKVIADSIYVDTNDDG